MSKLIIKYNDERNNKRDITGVTIKTTPHFLKLEYKEDNVHYIPLCNIKEFIIEGHNTVRSE